MYKMCLLIAIALVLAACTTQELDDGYQFGDLSKLALREQTELKKAVDDYCDRNRDSMIRYAALNIIRLYFPLIPENGICGKP